MQNIECKHELRDLDLCRTVIARLEARHVTTVRQKDTYFKVADGRLKRREVPGEPVEWILYHRLNRPQARLSHFQIFSEGEAVSRYGLLPLPVWVVVEKTREIWMRDTVRLHLDQVDRLGKFFEIEALVSLRQHLGACHRLVGEFLKELGPILGEAISLSYSDMVAAEQEG